MSPLISTILSILFLVAGALAVWFMLSVQGRGEVADPKKYMRMHKVMGWIFVLLFLVLFITMIGRIGDYWEVESARIALHAALAVGLLLLLIVKALIPRFFPRLGKHLFALGITVYLLAFILVGISGGYHMVWLFRETPYISHANIPEHMHDMALGKELFITKCSTCHSLDKIMNYRSVESWTVVVNEMVKLAEPRIKPDEAQQILHYLSETHVPRPFEGPENASLFEKHCLPCHAPQEIMKHSYTKVGWTEIVKQMNAYDPVTVPLDKVDEIVEFLLEYQHEV